MPAQLQRPRSTHEMPQLPSGLYDWTSDHRASPGFAKSPASLGSATPYENASAPVENEMLVAAARRDALLRQRSEELARRVALAAASKTGAAMSRPASCENLSIDASSTPPDAGGYSLGRLSGLGNLGGLQGLGDLQRSLRGGLSGSLLGSNLIGGSGGMVGGSMLGGLGRIYRERGSYGELSALGGGLGGNATDLASFPCLSTPSSTTPKEPLSSSSNTYRRPLSSLEVPPCSPPPASPTLRGLSIPAPPPPKPIADLMPCDAASFSALDGLLMLSSAASALQPSHEQQQPRTVRGKTNHCNMQVTETPPTKRAKLQ